MEIYEAMRRFADSWGLLALFLFFCGVILRALFLPSVRRNARDAAMIPFRDDPEPKDR
jgi:cytochrome c oxidase cbb3-type subunit 4